MANYKDIKGTNVQDIEGNPDNPLNGQLWYNSQLRVVRGDLFANAAWATGGNMNNGRATMGSFGIQTAAVIAGGEGPGPFSPQGNGAEEYNGTTWSTTNNIPVAKREMAGGAGTESAGLICGGFSYPPFSIKTGTEEYDGSSWTSGGALASGFRGKMCLGQAQTAALAYGGNSPTTPVQTGSEEYDGSSWTGGGTMSDGRENAGGSGTQTSGLAFGGNPSSPGPGTKTEEYDGTSWTSGGALNVGRHGVRGGTQGTQTAAIAMGAPTPSSSNTELYDGTSWTTSTNLSTARDSGGGGGTQTSAIFSGGSPSPVGTSTEEFTNAGNQSVSLDVD